MDPLAVARLAAAFFDSSDGQALKSRELTLVLLECTAAAFSRHQFTPGHITGRSRVLRPLCDSR